MSKILSLCVLILLCAATRVHAQRFHFGSLPNVKIELPAPTRADSRQPAPTRANPRNTPHGAPQQVLANACNGDGKCVCINSAIFKHDSSWATKGVGAHALNPCNMRLPSWTPSVGQPKVYRTASNGTFSKYDTLEDGITACVELYQRNYSDMPPAKLVRIWTNGEANASYKADVSNCYL